jgi:hypothetical protein
MPGLHPGYENAALLPVRRIFISRGHAAVIHRASLAHQHEMTDPFMRLQLGIEALTGLLRALGDPRRGPQVSAVALRASCLD